MNRFKKGASMVLVGTTVAGAANTGLALAKKTATDGNLIINVGGQGGSGNTFGTVASIIWGLFKAGCITFTTAITFLAAIPKDTLSSLVSKIPNDKLKCGFMNFFTETGKETNKSILEKGEDFLVNRYNQVGENAQVLKDAFKRIAGVKN